MEIRDLVRTGPLPLRRWPGLRAVGAPRGEGRGGSSAVLSATSSAVSARVTLQHVRFRYPQAPHDLFAEVSLGIAAGELVGLEGPNGAGKSTLLDLIAGDLAPTRGAVALDDGTHLEYLPQGQQPFGRFTCAETLRYLATLYGGRPVSCGAFIAQLPDPLIAQRLQAIAPRFLWQVSGGERQVLHAALTLSRHADLLLLDEPFTAMDREIRERFAVWIAARCERGAAVVLTSHDDRDMARLATRRVRLADGTLGPA